MNKIVFATFIQTILVLLCLGTAFSLTGSPLDAKKQALDAQRLNQFQTISGSVRVYFQDKDTLPSTLADLTDSLNLSDPETSEPIEYKPLSETTFRLCTTFSLESSITDKKKYDRYTQIQQSYSDGKGCIDYEIPESTLKIVRTKVKNVSPIPGSSPSTLFTPPPSVAPLPTGIIYEITGTLKNFETRARPDGSYQVIVVDIHNDIYSETRKFNFPHNSGIKNSRGEVISFNITQPGDTLIIKYTTLSPDVSDTVEIINMSR